VGRGQQIEPTDPLSGLWARVRKTPWSGLIGWVPGPIAALLNEWFAPLRKIPVLWSPEWARGISGPDALGLWFSVVVVAVLYVVQRDLNKSDQAKRAMIFLIAFISLFFICIIFNNIFYYYNIQPQTYGILQVAWQLSYVAMIVSAAVAITFGALYARKRS
jgi:hypothetical protein